MDGTRRSTSNRLFEVRCDVQWDRMRLLDAAGEIRRCERCDRTVHFCRSVAEVGRHARLDHCVAFYESGPCARVTANSLAAAAAPENPPAAEEPFDPFGPGALPPMPPQPPWEVRIPTAGVPRKVDVDETATDGPKSTARTEY